MLSVVEWIGLGIAGVAAGALNAVAGGGTFITLPVLISLGLPPVTANASSTVAMLPGYLAATFAGRRRLTAAISVSRARLLGTAAAGAVFGAAMLLISSEVMFAAVVPWLVALATLLFVFDRRLRDIGAGPRWLLPAVALGCAYGGYFNGALGVVLLAALGCASTMDLHTANAWKNALSAVVAGVALVVLGAGAAIAWPVALVLMAATTVGGLCGARVADALPAAWLRTIVVSVGLGASLWLWVAV